MSIAITQGVHHVGLTVSELEQSASFFVNTLGWEEVRRIDDYPAIFVSDGTVMLTLWKTRDTPATDFNKDRNVGLHHIALMVESEDALMQVHNRLIQHEIAIEFAPEFLRDGPAKHMMCIEPSGIRVEFIWLGV